MEVGGLVRNPGFGYELTMETLQYFILLYFYFRVCKMGIFTKRECEEDHFLCYISILLGLGDLAELHHH